MSKKAPVAPKKAAVALKRGSGPNDRARIKAGPGKKHGKRIKVRALADLYSDDNKYHRVGDVLHIDEHHFDERIHESVDGRVPTKTTSSGEALDAQRRATLESRAATRGLTTGIDNPTGQEDVLHGDE